MYSRLKFLLNLLLIVTVNTVFAVQLEVPFLQNQDSTGGAWKENVTLVKTSSGETRVFWNDARNGNHDILGRLFYKDGTVSDNGFKINDDTGFADQANPVIDINNIDYCVMVWEDERDGSKDIYGQKIGADLFILGENFKANSNSDYSIQQNPAISLNDSGEFLIVWEDNRNGNWDIYAQKYDFWGLPSGDNFLISTLSNNTDAVSPDVYYHSDGSAVIVWCDERNGQSDLFMRWYDTVGNILAADSLINDDNNAASQSQPALYVGSSDTGFVVWSDTRNGNSDIYMQKFVMSGELIGNNQMINYDEDGDEQQHPCIHFADSLMIVAWDDYQHGHLDIYAQAFDVDGNTVDNNFKVNTDTTNNEQSNPEVCVANDRSFVISWIDYREGYPNIFAQNYSSVGNLLQDNVMINQDFYSSPQENPSVATNHNGLSCTVWQDERNLYSDIYMQFRDINGDTVRSNIRVNTNDGRRYQATPECAVNKKGESVVIWRYDDRQGFMEIRGQRFDNNQQDVGDNFQVNTGPGKISDNRPAVAMNNQGAFSVVWRDQADEGYGIYLQLFDSEGNKVGDAMLVKSDVSSLDLKNSAIAMDSLGNTIVVWEDNRNGEYDIYCQWIDTTGALTGENVLVSIDSLDSYQGNPQVCMNEKGKGVIVWRDNRTGFPRIFAQHVHKDSGFVGVNFLVQDVAEPIRQLYPDVSIDSYGNFIIAWQELQDSKYTLKSLKFDYQGQKEGLTHYVTGLTAASQNSNPKVALSREHILYVWQDANRSKGWDIYGRLVSWEREDPTTSVAKLSDSPRLFETVSNYPNPFNHETMIKYQLDRNAYVTVAIYNVQGKITKKLYQGDQKSGNYTLHWDGTNTNGLVVSSGIYLVQVKADSRNIHHRMLMIK